MQHSYAKRGQLVAENSIRLAIVAGHPVQYVAPWLTRLAEGKGICMKVFYLWDFGVAQARDPGFGISVQWDIPMLEGYSHSFVVNRSSDPGNHHFLGYDNPSLAAELKAWGPDVVLLMNYAFLTYVRLLLDPRFWRIPFVFRGDSHDLARSGEGRLWLSRLLRRLIFSRFQAFLVVGKANAAYYRASGVPHRKLFAAPHAVDNDRFLAASDAARIEAGALRRQLGLTSDQLVILFVGKFQAIKRPLDLLEAFARLPADLAASAALVYVGSGNLMEPLTQRIAQLGLRNIHFLPFQNQSSMPSIYALGDVMVLPSQSETWGLVVNEAMNLECPVIVTDHVGCGPDLVLPGRTGWIYPTGDIEGLSRCLREALSDPDQLRGMGVAARRHVLSFSYDAVTAGLRQALAALVLRGALRPTAIPSDRQQEAV
jgi:glycosyltransferase involved in cell wall biosynthesis